MFIVFLIFEITAVTGMDARLGFSFLAPIGYQDRNAVIIHDGNMRKNGFIGRNVVNVAPNVIK